MGDIYHFLAARYLDNSPYLDNPQISIKCAQFSFWILIKAYQTIPNSPNFTIAHFWPYFKIPQFWTNLDSADSADKTDNEDKTENAQSTDNASNIDNADNQDKID